MNSITILGRDVNTGDVRPIPIYGGGNSRVISVNNTPPNVSNLDDIENVILSNPVENNVLKWNGTHWANDFVNYSEIIGKPDLLSQTVIINHSEGDTISGSLQAGGQGTYYQLSTGTHSESSAITISNQNIHLGCPASAGVSTLCEISNAPITLSSSSFRIRLANLQISQLLTIETNGGKLRHSVVNCIMRNGLTISSGTPSETTFIRFTDCEFNGGTVAIPAIANLTVYFVRCNFTGATLANNAAAAANVVFVDCVGLPSSYGQATIGGHTNFTNNNVITSFGYGSAARMFTNTLESGLTNTELRYTDELGTTRSLLSNTTTTIQGSQLVNSSLANSKLANTTVSINGLPVALGGSINLSINNLSNVRVSGAANNSVLFFNSTTGNVEATANVRVNSVNYQTANILIGQSTLTAGTANVIVLNTSPSALSTTSGCFYVSNNSVRTLTGSHMLQYDDSTGEVCKRLNKLLNIGDCSSDITFGEGNCLRWTSTGEWMRRYPDYYNTSVYGRLLSTRVDDLTEFGVLQSANWTTLLPDTTYAFPSTILLDTTTGLINGFSAAKRYKVEYHVSLCTPDISDANNTWMARIRGTSSTGSILREVRIANRIDNGQPSLHAIAIVSGHTSFYLSLQMTAGAYVNVAFDSCITVCIAEI